MVIIMAPTDNRHKFTRCNVALMSLITASSSSALKAADTEVKPIVEARAYSLQTDDNQLSNETEDAFAGYIKPSLGINLTGKNVSSALYIENESVWFDDSERKRNSLNEYDWRGAITGFDNRVNLGLNASSSHRVRDSRNGIFSDILSGAENLSKTSVYGAALNFQTSPTADITARLGFSYNSINSDAPEKIDGFGDVDNGVFGTNLLLGSKERQRTLFWQLTGSSSDVDRDTLSNFESRNLSAIAGLPLIPNLSLILRGSYYENSNGISYSNDFTSYGAGLEYQFGMASRVNITQNRSSKGVGLGQPDVKDDYLAAEIFLAPTRRTSISYTLDRRYFGRSADVSAQYRLKFLTVKLSVSENVQTLTAFDQVVQELGIFVCPNGAAGFGDCFRPPSSNYQLNTGESFLQLTNTDLELSEDLIKRRSALLSVGYSKNRLKLNMTLGKDEDQYVESTRLTERNTASLVSSWQLAKHAKLILNTRYYDIDYQNEDRQDTNLSFDFGLEHQLNAQSDVSLMFKRISRNSTVDSLDLQENRLWFGYKLRL